MKIVLIVCIVLIVLIFLYTQAIKPNTTRKEQLRPLEEKPIAHRGYFNNKGDAPENSMLAYERAVKMGIGFECDVHQTRDGKLAMLHDPTLKRMCGVDIPMNQLTYEQIRQYHLKDSDQCIPLFDDVLAMVDGRVPIVVEIKPHGDYKTTTKMVAKRLDSYEGPWVLESFHPWILYWFRKNRPDVLRGQLASDMFKNNLGRSFMEKLIVTSLVTNFLAKPDFISYNYKYRRNFSYRLCRKLYDFGNAGWTFRSRKALKKYGKRFDVIIFDRFLPKELESVYESVIKEMGD